MSDLLDSILRQGKSYLKTPFAEQSAEGAVSANDEQVLLSKFGKFWNQQNIWDRPDGTVVLTNHRLIFMTKLGTITTKTGFLSIPFRYMENPGKTTIWGFTPAIQFNLQGKPFVFTFMPLAQMAPLMDIIQQGRKGS